MQTANEIQLSYQPIINHKIKLENFKINQVDRQVHNLDYIKYKYVSTKKWISEITTTGSVQRSIESSYC